MVRKRSKNYRELLKNYKIEDDYLLDEAVDLVKKTSFVKFDPSVDIVINLAINPKKADHNVRTSITLPYGLGKKVRIVVFAKGEIVNKVSELGVEYVGDDDLSEKILNGWLDFDCVLATPDMMGKVSKLGKILGPKKLMPNPKTGTITFELEKMVKEIQQGRLDLKPDKAGIIHTSVGKLSFSKDKIIDNINSVLSALIKAKPPSVKSTYFLNCSLSSTMGPAVKVNIKDFSII